MAYVKVDLSALPAPTILEQISFEDILADLKATVATLFPSIEPVLQLESEPAVKVLQACAAYVMMTRARVNDAAKGMLLAYAEGSDLDQLGALLGVERKVLELETDTTPAVYENDTEFRDRIQLALEGFSTAGPRGAYEFHALSAHPDVMDVFVAGPGTPGLTVEAGTVEVYVLGRNGDGTPTAEILTDVTAALNDEEVRPLCDTVIVAGATISPFTVVAQLHVQPGPGSEVILNEAQAALDEYLTTVHRIGATVALSGIHAALHQSGVINVTVTNPSADIVPAPNVAPYATSTSITIAG
ncbi:baseplate assembly protein [Paracoccus sp. KR1-242]|uniref:baseplate assembly protein n=1 Tax=Paracoccus sp. KR1-242 TaxID=3410028 RepID=UPI003BFAEC11